ncbi:RIIa domain-containing protein 1 [Tyto alba]|uniref:RIIa domain-containing protein 1-like n=1 Tax=Tyto alba TaxID=56313 RepID=UPI001C684DCC|nr:RIIa domain-containing protein 1-like [Tyto alba]XP_042641619.1 RIIa domain-containing protein 1 [Tyto alba]
MASPQPPPRPHEPTLRLSSERYLRAHPGVRLLLRGFLRELLLHQPTNIPEFAAGYFSQPELPRRIQEELGGSAP